ncbi:MAG TPA: tetratricopeptide repeat protein, partial [Spirochaetota bacterium]
TIIILPFVSDGNIGYSWIAAGIYNYLERAMRGNSSIGVIPAGDVQTIAQYLSVKPNTPLPPELISQMVRLSGADEAISVRYFVTDGRISISIEIISGNDGIVRKSFSFFEPIDRVYEVEDAIYRGIVTDEKPVLAAPQPVKKWVKKKLVLVYPPKANIAPFEWYSRGVECMKSDPKESLSLFVKTLRYDPENASALISAASIVHHDQGIIDGALGYLLRADKIFVRHGESNTTKYASLMVKIADIYDHKHDDTRAQIYLARAFDIWKKRKNGFPDEYASFLTEIGMVYVHNNKHHDAIDYLSMAREVYEKRKQTDTLRYAWIMRLLGDSYAALGSDAVAEECYRTASSVFTALSLEETNDYAEIEFKRGKSLASLGRIDDAHDQFDASYQLFVKQGMNQRARDALSSMHGMTQPLPRRWRD